MSVIDFGPEYDLDGDAEWIDDGWVDEGGLDDGGMDEAWVEETGADLLRDVLHDDLADASSDDLDEAWAGVLDQLSPAEGLSLSRALSGARALVSNPAVLGAVKSGLPIGTSVLGAVGGPAGAVLAGQLGRTVANALPGAARVPTAAAAAQAAPTSVAAGSQAATQAIYALQHPLVTQALGALALGAAGKPAVGSVAVTDIAKMLNAIFNQVASDADELSYSRGPDEGDGDSYFEDSVAAPGHALYTTLVDLDNAELVEEW
jgi:hypothetical protein